MPQGYQGLQRPPRDARRHRGRAASRQGKFLHCVHTAHAEVGILTQVIRLVVTILFPRNPFQKNEQSKNI